MDNTYKKLIKFFSKNLHSIAFNEDLVIGSDKSWQQHNHRDFLSKIEKEFEVKFTDEEIKSMVSFKIIYATLISYKE